MKRLALSLLAAALAVSLAACGRPARNTDDLEALLEELEDYAPSSEADTSQQEGPDLSQITPPHRGTDPCPAGRGPERDLYPAGAGRH